MGWCHWWCHGAARRCTVALRGQGMTVPWCDDMMQRVRVGVKHVAIEGVPAFFFFIFAVRSEVLLTRPFDSLYVVVFCPHACFFFHSLLFFGGGRCRSTKRRPSPLLRRGLTNGHTASNREVRSRTLSNMCANLPLDHAQWRGGGEGEVRGNL